MILLKSKDQKLRRKIFGGPKIGEIF